MSLGVRPQPCPATSPKAAATGNPRPSCCEQKLLHTHLWLDPGALRRAGGAAGPPSQQGPSLPPAGVASGQPTGARGLNHKEAGPRLGAWTVGFSPALGAGTVHECPGNSDRPFPTAPDCPPVPAGGPDAWTFVSGRRPAAHPGKTPGGACSHGRAPAPHSGRTPSSLHSGDTAATRTCRPQRTGAAPVGLLLVVLVFASTSLCKESVAPTLFLRAWRCPSAPSAPPQRVPKRRRGFIAARRQASDSDVPRFLSGRLRQDPACAPPPALGTRESPAR